MDRSPLHAVARRSLPKEAAAALDALGIATLEQFLEASARNPAAIKQALGSKGLAALRQQCADAKDSAVSLSPIEPGFVFPPLTGIAGPLTDAPKSADRRRQAGTARQAILQRLKTLRASQVMPTKKLLTNWMTPVKDQGPYGFCVGFGSTASREFLSCAELSPGWAYRGAKALDGRPDLEGSWQVFALEFMAQVGHVGPEVYSYDDAIADRPLDAHFRKAEPLRISGFVDLLLDAGDLKLMPTLIKAILSGVFSSELGPQPVSVSLALYESFASPVTATTGLMRLPLPGESRLGGHAMCVVGYLEANDPDNLYGLNYFLVRNSFGERWAARNPLGHPGHALIPEAYFTKPELLWECLLCLAEPSPTLEGWLGRLLRTNR
jgi:hypothetical protein